MEYGIHASVITKDQLRAIGKTVEISRIYVEPTSIINDSSLINEYTEKELYLCSPFILRKSNIEKFRKLIDTGAFKGILVRNLETYSYLNANYDKYKNLDLVLDSNMYVLNTDALRFYIENSKIDIDEFYASYELNAKERAMIEQGDRVYSSVIYGRIPMMVSANCINKTLSTCEKTPGFCGLEDRYKKAFPIYTNCEFCYNVIYNCVPLSLHNYFDTLLSKGNLRLDFTDEGYGETKNIVNYFASLHSRKSDPCYLDYTTGHYKRGVE